MAKVAINTNTEANKIDAKIIEQLTNIKLSPDKDYFYNVVFGNKKRPDFIIKNFVDANKYSFILENKLRYASLIDAKEQALDYATYLYRKQLLTSPFILIITDAKSFYVSKYKIDDEIVYMEDLNYIDCFADLTYEFFKSNSNLKEVKPISIHNQRNLKDIFDRINNKLRHYGLSKDQRMHLTMAMLFLKLIKENIDLFGETIHKKELEDNLANLDVNLTESNIGNVFRTIAKIFEKKFAFSIDEYLGNNLLVELWDIIKELNLDSYDLDVKGEAFEYFINYGNIKSDMGEYFTPRHIVKFMIKCLNEVMKDRWLTNNKGQPLTYFDPTCGTGGFLINIFKELRREIVDDKDLLAQIKTKYVYGTELSKRTSEIAKMNMILAGDGHTNIINDDFLEYENSHKNYYDVSIGNMPFGKKINETSFVEGFLDVVKEGGYSIFIVPSGIIGTTSKNEYIRIREKLLTEGRLLKLISLPQGVFAPYTFSKTYIIFWKKERPATDYAIEYFEIENDGFTLNNQRDIIKGDSDIDTYYKDRNKLIKEKKIFYVNSNKIFNVKELNQKLVLFSSLSEKMNQNKEKIKVLNKQIRDIIDNKQREEKQSRRGEIESENSEIAKQVTGIQGYKDNLTYSLKFSLFRPVSRSSNGNKENMMPLSSIADIVRGPFGSSIKKSVCVDKGIGKYKIYEQSNVINNDFETGRYYLTEDKFNELRRFEIKKDDMLMTCAGTLGKVAVVPETFERGIYNSVIMRFRCNLEIIRPKYLKLVLQSEKMQNMLVKDCIGVGIKNMIPTKELKKIQIPVPSLVGQDEIIKEIEEMDAEINRQIGKIKEIKLKQSKKLNIVANN